MAQQLSEILSSLDNVYKPQAAAIQQQQAALPAYYQAQQQGLDQTKNNAFQGITDSANSHGMFYSGAPIAEQQKYVGATYLPAVAGLQKDQQDQQFKLSSALSDVTGRQYNQAYDIQQKQQAQDAANAAAARQASMLQNLYSQPTSAGKTPTAPSGAVNGLDQRASSLFNYIQALRQNNDPLAKNWGALAQHLASRGEDISHGSAADKALNAYFRNDQTPIIGPANKPGPLSVPTAYAPAMAVAKSIPGIGQGLQLADLLSGLWSQTQQRTY